jgi:hypothetical protein
MRSAPHLALLLALAVTGCTEDGATSARKASGAAPIQSAPVHSISGRLLEAPEGAVVFLVKTDPQARDLYALAGTLLSSVEADPDGGFCFESQEGDGVLVLAPGKAIARAAIKGDQPLDIALTPEARLIVQVGEPYAAALVLDAQGVPLPLPAAELVSHADGTLRATRVPAGQFTVIVQSADGERHGSRAIALSASDERSITLPLVQDAELGRRFLLAAGGAALKHPLVLAGDAR